MALEPVGLIFGVDGGAEHGRASTGSRRGTGWCLVDYGPEHVSLAAHGHVLGGPDAWLDAVVHDAESDAYAAMRRATAHVVEDFTVLRRGAVKIDPLEIVGMQRMFAALHGLPCAVQPPKQRLAVTHDDLRRIGMWPGGAGHADTAQAIRHVLRHLMAHRHMPTLMLVSPPPGDDETAP